MEISHPRALDFADRVGARSGSRLKQLGRSIAHRLAWPAALSLLLGSGVAAQPSKKPAVNTDANAKAKAELPSIAKHSDADLFSGDSTEPISLGRAIEMALQNNLEARVEKVGIRIQRSQIRFAAGAFDPVFSISGLHQSVRIPQDINNPNTTQVIQQQQSLQLQLNQAAQSLNAQTLTVQQQLLNQAGLSQTQIQQQIQQANFLLALEGKTPVTLAGISSTTITPLQQQALITPNLNNFVVLDQVNDQFVAGIQARTPYGTRYSFQASENRFRNTFSGDISPVTPLSQTFIGLTVEQPLLRNAGRDANLADLRVTALNKQIQTFNWKQSVSSAVQNVMATYFDMMAALQDMHVREDAIDADSKLVDLYRRRLDLGFATPLDVQQAEVAVSTDREALLASKNVFLERQFALKRLILDKFEANDSRIFVPETTLRLTPPKTNRADLLQTAFGHRYDYHATVLGADVQNVRLKFAQNQRLPQVDLVATYGFNGLDASFAQSEGQIFTGATPQWSIGVNVQIPIGNRQPREQYNAIAGQKEQAILRIKESELTVSVDVDTVISRLETYRQRVDTSRQTRELGEEAVRIAYRRLDEGLISAFDVIDQQRKLYDAKSREIAAIGELSKAVTQLWLVTGTVLDRQGITFRDVEDKITTTPLGVCVKEKKPSAPAPVGRSSK